MQFRLKQSMKASRYSFKAKFPVDISVVICTYNRAGMLKDTLQSWLTVDKDQASVELIVVDNNSTDQTYQIVQQFQNRVSNDIRYVFEAKPGLSFARNKGIKAARGSIIAFVDDDVYFQEDWLEKIMDAFRDHPQADCIGGNSIPFFETKRPSWLSDDLFHVYSSTGSGSTGKAMKFPEHPFGVNMAFKRTVFERVGMFNTALGRVKTSLLSNEEKELFYRIDRAGFKTYYTPDAVINHRIPAERLNRKWVLKRLYWQGISRVVFDQLIHRRTKFDLFKDAVKYTRRAIFGSRPLSAQNCIFFFSDHCFPKKRKTALLLGMAKQSLAEIMNRNSIGPSHTNTRDYP